MIYEHFRFNKKKLHKHKFLNLNSDLKFDSIQFNKKK